MIISNCIHVATNGIISFFFYGWVVFHCIYIYHIFFIHSPVNGHLGCFHVLECPNLDNSLCMLKKHNKLETDHFPSRKCPLSRRASVVIYFHFFMLIIYFRRFPLIRELYIQETCCEHGPQWKMAFGGRNLAVSCWNSSFCQHQRGYGCFRCPWYTRSSSTPAPIVSTQLYSVRAQCCLPFQRSSRMERRGHGLWCQTDLGSDLEFPSYKLCGLKKIDRFLSSNMRVRMTTCRVVISSTE